MLLINGETGGRCSHSVWGGLNFFGWVKFSDSSDATGLDLMSSKGPVQPKSFCDLACSVFWELPGAHCPLVNELPGDPSRKVQENDRG